MAVNKLDPKIIFASEAPVQDTPAVFNNKTLGWGESRKNGGRPTIKQMNALQQDTELKILWLNENAVTPFDATIDYPEGAVTIKDGSFKQLTSGSWVEFLDGFADKDAVKRGIANLYDSSFTYNLGDRVVTDNGDIVQSVVVGNTVDPNIDMTGWVLTNSDSQIITWSGRTQEGKNKDFVTAEDFGAIGDGTLHKLSDKYQTIEEAQLAYPLSAQLITTLEHSIDWAAIQEALYSNLGGVVNLLRSTYLITDTIYVPYGSTLQGQGQGIWNVTPSRDVTLNTAPMYELNIGSNLLFVGDGEKKHTQQFITANETGGFSRPNPASVNALDATFDMMDLSNRDAVGATAATLKKFSICIKLGDGRVNYGNGAKLKNLRIVTSCMKDKSKHGTQGYYPQDPSYEWARWDVGVMANSAWRIVMEDVNVVGYYMTRAVVITPIPDEVPEDTLRNVGVAEHGRILGCRIQGGLSIRGGDVIPVEYHSDTALKTKWFASHQFKQSGTLQAHAISNFSYTSLTYDSSTGYLIFNGVDSAKTALVNTRATCIEMQQSGGSTHTQLQSCEITDFSHHGGWLECESVFGDYAMKPRAALEMGGNPVRGLKVFNCSFACRSKVMWHLGIARDVELLSAYMESKSTRASNTGSSGIGAVLICGWTTEYESLMETYYRSEIYMTGTTISDGINVAPHILTTSGTTAIKGMTDLFKPYYFYCSQYNMSSIPATFHAIRGMNGQGVSLTSRTKAGSHRSIITGYGEESKIELGEEALKLLQVKTIDNIIENTSPRLRFNHTDGLSDCKVWGIDTVNSGGNFTLSTFPDDTTLFTGGVSTVAIEINRTGQTPTNTRFNTSVIPYTTGVFSLGAGSRYWKDIYATNGTITTSDEKYKQQFTSIDDAEKAAALEIKANIKKFKFNDAVDLKGEDARWHFGVSAQNVVKILESHGLSPFNYGFICYDEWEATEEIINTWSDEFDEDGNLVRAAGSEVVQEAEQAGSRYAIRYDELSMFILATI